MPPSGDTILDVMAFAGIGLLAVPVLTLDRRKARAARRARGGQRTGAMAVLRDRADARIETWVVGWRRLDRACLWLGYLLLLGSALGRIWV